MRNRPGVWVLSGAALLAVFALSLTAAIVARGWGVVDDAFITFRVARNLAEGHGLQFNLEGPPVEAASNFLLVALLAGARRLGGSLIQTSVLIGVVAAALTLPLLYGCVRRHAGRWALLAPLALATMSLYARNAINGLETGLLTLLLLASTWLFIEGDDPLRPRPRLLLLASLLLAAVSLTRPEGPMYFLALSALRIPCWRTGRLRMRDWRRLVSPGRSRTQLLCWLGGFLLLYLPYTLWRLNTFGAILPNTFHAKEAQFIEFGKLHTGAIYLGLMMLKEPLLPLSLIAGAVAQGIAPDRRMRTLLALVLVQCLFMVLSGGDWPHMFGHARFLVPVLPLILWILVESGERLLKLRRRRAVCLGALLLVGISQVDLSRRMDLLHMPPQYHHRVPVLRMWESLYLAYLVKLPQVPRDEFLRSATWNLSLRRYHNTFDAWVGLWLRDRYGTETPIASVQAGQFAFWCEMPFFDMFGLASTEVTRLGRFDPHGLGDLLREFDPRLIAFYKMGRSSHHRPLVQSGFLKRQGYGLRYVFLRGRRAFVVFEKGYAAQEDPDVLFTSIPELKKHVDPDRLIRSSPVRP